jgi:ribosomal protein L37AE/L43A
MSIHHSAIQHLNTAASLMEKGDYDSLRYAVLELRYGLECLVYELLPHYASELPDDVLEGWKPSEMLRAMVDCNPDLPHTVSLASWPSGPGREPGAGVLLGTQTGITSKELLGEYNRLGSFLHAKKPDGRPHDDEKLRRSVLIGVEFLERYRNDSVIQNFGVYQTFTCGACGRPVKRRQKAIDPSRIIRCPNKDCGAEFQAIPEGDGFRFRMFQAPFTCPQCGVKGFFDRHRLGEGVKIQCRGCEKEFVLRFAVLTPQQDQELRTEPNESRDLGTLTPNGITKVGG